MQIIIIPANILTARLSVMPIPVVILYPGVGMFTFAKDKQTARVAAEFYINAINVMKGAEAISEYTSLPRQEAFNIEYWLLEEAKLQRMPKPKALSGRIALITGSAGGIGKAIAKKFAEEGACVILNDNECRTFGRSKGRISKHYLVKMYLLPMYWMLPKRIVLNKHLKTAALAFGGVDIMVNNAGFLFQNPLKNIQKKIGICYMMYW